MRYYKVFVDYKNYIPIDETELEKALKAFIGNKRVVFNEGATSRIEIILPDNVRMMGWNAGYNPGPEEHGEIARNPACRSAKELLAEMKTCLQLGEPTAHLQLQSA
jgi:hypothetical protein